MYAVIMAGGGGTRLWPLSRGARPKPFLPLLEGGRCLLEQTVSHLDPLISHDDVYVVTDARYADMVRQVAPEIPAANIIGEPMGRNTAAAVALAAHAIDRPPSEVMLVLPADQAIHDAQRFPRSSRRGGSARHGWRYGHAWRRADGSSDRLWLRHRRPHARGAWRTDRPTVWNVSRRSPRRNGQWS